MRLIDADALVETMQADEPELWSMYDAYSLGLHDQYLYDLTAVEAAPTVGGWISVKDRMPELEGDYLVTDGHCVPWKCRLLKLAGVKGWVNGASNPVINYWMPLPEPPEEGEVG